LKAGYELAILIKMAYGGTMLTASASLFKKDFGNFQRKVRRGPIEVVNHGEPTGYFVSPEDFAEYQRLRAAASRRHLRPADLSDAQRNALRETRVPAEFAAPEDLMNS
jgi:prevent-host-death family protein